jgi:hypothetical protein
VDEVVDYGDAEPAKEEEMIGEDEGMMGKEKGMMMGKEKGGMMGGSMGGEKMPKALVVAVTAGKARPK